MTKKDAKPERKAYEVGYKKPPVKNQFKAGKSGNPTGRRAKRQSPEEYLSAMMAKQIVVSENGASRKMTRAEALIHRLYAAAIKGDLRTGETIFKILSKQAAAEAAKEPKLDLNVFTDEELHILKSGHMRARAALMNAEIEMVRKKYSLSNRKADSD